MAELSQVELNNVTYNLKDSEARENISALNQVTIYEQKSGSIVSFEASAENMPIKSLVVTIEPMQEGSGNPSSNNIRPISGYTEVNVGQTNEFAARCNNEVRQENGLTITSTSDNYIDIDGKADATNGVSIVTFTATNDILYISNLIVADATYSWFLWNVTTSHNDSGIVKDLNGNYTLTIGNTYSIGFRANKNYTYDHIKTRIMLSYSQPSNISVNWQDSAGTVYGGTLDVISGKMKVNRAFIEFDADTNIKFNNHGATGAGENFNYWFSCYFTPTNVTNDYDKWLFSHGICGATAWSEINRAYKASSNNRIYLLFGVNEDVSNVAEVKSFFAAQKTAGTPVQLVYTLATPIEYQLTPQEVTTLLGTNHIWADIGDITVSYGAYLETIQNHADQLGDSILSAIAPLETTYTASRSYTIGSYLFVGTKFYKVTAAIAEGGTITPDTNVTQTTVAEQLMALAAN